VEYMSAINYENLFFLLWDTVCVCIFSSLMFACRAVISAGHRAACGRLFSISVSYLSVWITSCPLIALRHVRRPSASLATIARDSMLSALYAIANPSVCLSVTRVDQSKTVEARIMQFSPYSRPIPLLFMV